ncbi:uncharacterized protein LOC121735395 [Aricia agestis]|uniref:uncharacterized protein LOC121735395 n=1 Tax=Aricia agestis TaxID=91739 RepID=UPI001C20642B|nr:uncharacterized protein LOC121735395 [Aricia agestis]
MAFRNFCVCVLLALAAGNLITAEEERSWPTSLNMSMGDFFNMFFGSSIGNSSRTKRALPYFASCNYTNSSQTGLQCRDCNTASRCYPNNMALVRSCSGIFPYCNNGRCSFQPGPLCSSGSSGSGSGSGSGSSNSSSTNSTSG